MSDYEQSCADVLELIQMLVEDESIKIGTDVQSVNTVVNADNKMELFIQMKGGMNVRVEVG